MALKGILQEEYDNALRLKKRYQQALEDLPKGSLIQKKIKGYPYYYVVYRNPEGKVCFDYLGKEVSEEKKQEFVDLKAKRAQYRKLLSQVGQEIKFLRKSLRGK